MPKDTKKDDSIWQTGIILGGLAAVTALFFAGNPKGATAGAVLAAGIGGVILHEVGKERRPAANAVNKANNFFGNSGRNIQNALDNVLEGGKAIGDELEKQVQSISKN